MWESVCLSVKFNTHATLFPSFSHHHAASHLSFVLLLTPRHSPQEKRLWWWRLRLQCCCEDVRQVWFTNAKKDNTGSCQRRFSMRYLGKMLFAFGEPKLRARGSRKCGDLALSVRVAQCAHIFPRIICSNVNMSMTGTEIGRAHV